MHHILFRIAEIVYLITAIGVIIVIISENRNPLNYFMDNGVGFSTRFGLIIYAFLVKIILNGATSRKGCMIRLRKDL